MGKENQNMYKVDFTSYLFLLLEKVNKLDETLTYIIAK